MPEVTPGDAPESYSPNVRIGYPDQLYFGDTHVHTNLSTDAYAMGDHTLGPEAAYRFAKGEVVTMHSGEDVASPSPRLSDGSGSCE